MLKTLVSDAVPVCQSQVVGELLPYLATEEVSESQQVTTGSQQVADVMRIEKDYGRRLGVSTRSLQLRFLQKHV